MEKARTGHGKFVVHDGLLCCTLHGEEVALVVPDDHDLCTELLMLHHETPLAAKPLKCLHRSRRGCCNHWCHLTMCLRNAQWTSLLTCLSPSKVVMQLQCLWIVCLSKYILCLVRVRFPLKNQHSCSLQQWRHGTVCLIGSYLIAMADTLVGFGSL